MDRVPTLEQIKNALPTIGRIAIFGATTAALGTCSDNGLAHELVKHLHDTVTDTQQVEDLVKLYGKAGEVSGGLVSGFLANHIGNVGEKLSYGINSDLEKALQEAIAKAVPQLKKELLDYYGVELDEAGRAAFHNLFERIGKVQLRGLELEKEDIEVFVLRDHALFQNLFTEPYKDWDDVYYRPDNFPENFESAIAYGLAILVRQHFHELLKDQDNRRAQVAYFIYLLEFNARTSQQNGEKLTRVLAALDKLSNLPEVLETLSRDFNHAHELTVECLRSLNRHVREAKAEILDEIRLHHQPDLYLPERSAAKHYDYHYKAEYTDFVGRDSELEQLRQFVLTNPERRFCWWMLTGAGGSGKSRTALRLCRQLKSWHYYAGFLEKHSLENMGLWVNWQPRHPTLIVIDYATLYLEAVKELLKTLEHHQKHYQHPVRVLLLERDIRTDWWERLTLATEVKRSCYVGDEKPQSSDMLALPPLGDLRWDIISQIHHRNHKRPPSDPAVTLETLHGMDPLDRPLFAFFAGMALVEGENIRGWNKADLLDNLLVREEENLWKIVDHPLADKHLNLLALATLTRGLSSNQLKNIRNRGYDWLHLARTERVDEVLYSRMSGFRQVEGAKVYKGLEPDLVGEYFVLRRLNQILTADAEYGSDTVREIIQTAWATQPEAMRLMAFMTHLDFFQAHQGVHEYLLKTLPHEEASEEIWEEWGWQWVNFTGLLDGDTCERYYVLFNDVAEPFLTKKEPLKIKKAQALFNLAAELSGPDLLSDAQG
ncbi:ATP-binding protein, partial [Persicitalea jodogahamensis]|uniref:ATP-binding protein n=1 Tax=Persicitalea jodogahamensis TaxID=402147 RepID=UPI001672A4CC